MKTGAVILAAGYSSRMGDFKPLLQIGGRSLIEHTISLFRDNGVDHIVVVTGHKEDEVAAEAERLNVQTVSNTDFADGMFSSVCVGISQLPALDAFFVLPVDIPLIRSSTVQTLLHAEINGGVIYPCFDGERGHPPLISREVIPAILKHNGQGGLKQVLEQFPGLDVPVWDEGILLDADTPEDFKNLLARFENMESGSRAEAQALAAITMQQRGINHGEAAAKIACAIGNALNSNGYSLDEDLIYNGALLHDIAKGRPHHESEGAAMLKTLGLHQLVDIVGSHRETAVPDSGRLTAKEIVCLADKLVRGTEQMPIRQRFDEKLVLYANDEEACKAINRRLQSALDLAEKVRKDTGTTVEEIITSEVGA